MRPKFIESIQRKWAEGLKDDPQSRPQFVARQFTELAQHEPPTVEIGSTVTVRANDQAQIYAIGSCLDVAIEAGHLRDFDGSAAPLIRHRLVQCSEELLKHVVPLPEHERIAHFESWCFTALDLGFNAIFLGSGFADQAPSALTIENFLQVAEQLSEVTRRFNLGLGIDITRFGREDFAVLQPFFYANFIQYAFHGQLAATLGNPEGLLADERLLLGLNSLRALFPTRTLIVAHLLEKCFGQRTTLPLLLARLPKQCALSFCAVGDSPEKIFGLPHPIWEVLRAKSILGQLPLIPIFNPGQSGWGGGLWPTIPVLEWEALMHRCVKEKFESVVALTPRLPPKAGFLRASLWCFGQRMCWNIPVEDLLGTWMAACRSNWSLPKEVHLQWLQLSRSLQKLSQLKSRGCDLNDVETLRKTIHLYRLRLRQWVEGPQLLECAHLFLTDARQLLIAALQDGVGAHQGTQYHALLQALLQEETGEEGMWTEIRGSGAGARAGWRALPLTTKHRGAEGLAGDSGFAQGAKKELSSK